MSIEIADRMAKITHSMPAMMDRCVRPGVAGLLTGVEYSRVRDSAWMYLTSTVTTRIAVELVDVQGNCRLHWSRTLEVFG